MQALRPDLDDEQRAFLSGYVHKNVMPFLSPQIINSRHPFPHLENGALSHVAAPQRDLGAKKAPKADGEKPTKEEEAKNLGAEGVTLGLVPMPRQCERVIALPGDGLQFILLEHAIEMVADEIFSMYAIKHTNVICVTATPTSAATGAPTRERRGLPRAREAHPQEALPPGARAARKRAPAVPPPWRSCCSSA